MKAKTARSLAVAGLLLQIGIPVGLLAVVAGILVTLGSMSGDVAQAAVAINRGVALALRGALIGQGVALVGLALLLVVLFGEKIRAPWLLKWGRIAMVPWLLMIGVGTVIGVLMLVYFSKHRAEFTDENKTPNQALQHNDPSCHASCLRTPRASRGRG